MAPAGVPSMDNCAAGSPVSTIRMPSPDVDAGAEQLDVMGYAPPGHHLGVHRLDGAAGASNLETVSAGGQPQHQRRRALLHAVEEHPCARGVRRHDDLAETRPPAPPRRPSRRRCRRPDRGSARHTQRPAPPRLGARRDGSSLRRRRAQGELRRRVGGAGSAVRSGSLATVRSDGSVGVAEATGSERAGRRIGWRGMAAGQGTMGAASLVSSGRALSHSAIGRRSPSSPCP